MRCIDFTKEKVLRLRVVYKWGSQTVALDSNDFVTFSDYSAGGACLPEVKRFGGKFDSLLIVCVYLSHPKFNQSFALLGLAFERSIFKQMYDTIIQCNQCLSVLLAWGLQLILSISAPIR